MTMLNVQLNVEEDRLRPFLFAPWLKAPNLQLSIFNFQKKKGSANIDEMMPASFETNSVWMETEIIRMEINSIRMEMGVIWEEMKSVPMETEAVPMETGIIPMETESIPMEREVISSLDFSILRPATNNANILIN
jgi:hypothetical protein